MAQTTLNVRMDEDVKKELEIFCAEVGMNVSVAVNLFAKTVIREQRLPFEIATKKPNKDTIQVMEDVTNKVNLSKKYTSLSEALEALNATD